MIEKATAFKVGDKTFGTLAEAQIHELRELLDSCPRKTESMLLSAELSSQLAEWLVSHGDQVIDILTTGPRSKPRARRINGGKKTRPPKPEGVAA